MLMVIHEDIANFIPNDTSLMLAGFFNILILMGALQGFIISSLLFFARRNRVANRFLGKTNLYAQNDHHFFLKIMETDIDFIKDAKGKVIKAVLDDEGEHYVLTKTK